MAEILFLGSRPGPGRVSCRVLPVRKAESAIGVTKIEPPGTLTEQFAGSFRIVPDSPETVSFGQVGDLPGTRAGGQDDVSSHKLPQNICRDLGTISQIVSEMQLKPSKHAFVHIEP